MDIVEKEINEGELIILNVLDSLVGTYKLPEKIKIHIKELMEELREDVEVIDNSDRDFDEVKLFKRTYYVEEK